MAAPVDRRLAARLEDRAVSRRTGARWRSPATEELRQRLQRLLGERGGESVHISTLERMAGGGTNELYRVEFADRRPPTVLRLKIPGAGVVTDVLREFQAMRAAARHLPVPDALEVVEDPGDLGAPALLISLEPGVQSPAEDEVRASGMGIQFPESLRVPLGEDFVRHLAALHAAPVVTHELSAFELPELPGTTECVERELAFWDRVWEEDRLERHPTLLLASRWLREHAPPVDRISLLHGDYRSGNFLFDPEARRVSSIIDWEMTAVGDRHRDLAYTMLEAFGDRGPDGRFRVAGLVPRQEFLATYEAASGLAVDRERIRYYLVFNMYWSTISMLGTGLHNARAGETQLDVMYGVMAGQAARSCQALQSILER